MSVGRGSSKLDPFDGFPFKLTFRHHQLLHHGEDALLAPPEDTLMASPRARNILQHDL